MNNNLELAETTEDNKDLNIIEVKNLTKTFELESLKIEAVKNISFSVRKGEIFGFLGPNGAGKTTTLNILSTILFPTSGTASIAGNDILKNPDAVRRSIGIVFQGMSLDMDLTAYENLDLHATLYGVEKKVAKQRINEMLEIVDLKERQKEFIKNYSGGMRRRLEIARGLLHYPTCLFLDEPTIGLDPQTRRNIWGHIKHLNKEYNITIILTTHYMDEADALCDRICIIDHGEIIKIGTSDELKKELKGDVLSLEFENSISLNKYKKLIQDFPGINAIKLVESKMAMPIGGISREMGSKESKNRVLSNEKGKMMLEQHGMKDINLDQMMKKNSTQMNISLENASEKVPSLIKIANNSDIKIKSLTIKKPSLEDVFIHYTGRQIRDESNNGMKGMIQQMMTKMRGGH
ncbi:MAG: ATP-binding cassette domain-containing protein [Candidatus Lokiarchaeota archaeon]|nr:ATP-binding cassette domain-containing protein [Candidatus Lokiarchaeota archaeon]